MEQQQRSASPIRSTTPPAAGLQPTTVAGVASLIGKVRQLVRRERVTPLAQMSADDQTELHKAALAIIHSQDPARTRQAMDLALATAEGVFAEAGLTLNDGATTLIRSVASTAILTYRLALEGTLDQQGGVQ